MALTYRSPVETVLTLLEPSSQSLIASTATQSLQKSEQDQYSWFCYSLPAYAKEQLSRAGLYLSPFAGYPHSHPVCKSLENYILYIVLPSLVNNTFFFVGIKSFKLNFLKKRHKNMSLVSAINRYVTSADKVRYGNEFVYKESSMIPGLSRHKEPLESDTLKTLVPHIKAGSNLFFHDELHYWSKEDLITFLEVIQPEMLLASIVYPTELFVGAKTSLNPWCYDFEVRGGRLTFYPDGVRAEGYEQPLHGGYLLKSNRIELPGGQVYSVDVICSKFAHHLVSITRGELVTPKWRSYGPFDAIGSEGLRGIDRSRKKYYPISHNTVSRLYRYLRSLKKPDKQSAMAKFSQLVPDPSGAAIKFVEEFSHLVIGTSTLRTAIEPEEIKRFFGNLGLALPKALAAKVAATRAVCLESFVENLKPLSVDVELMSIRKDSNLFDWSVFIEEDEESGGALMARMDSGWAGGSIERSRHPYCSMLPLVDKRRKMGLLCHKVRYMCGLVDLYLSAYVSDHELPGSSLAHYLEQLRACSTHVGVSILVQLNGTDLDRMIARARGMGPPKTLHSERPIVWFLRRNDRVNCWAIECGAHIDSRNQIELSTHAKPAKKMWNVLPCTISNYICGDYYEEVVINGPASMHEVVSESTMQNHLRSTQACLCGWEFECQTFPCAAEHGAEYPYMVQGVAGGWYTAGGTEHIGTSGEWNSLGWPRWLQLWMQLHSIDGEHYNCMLAQKHGAGTTTGWHTNLELGLARDCRVLIVNVSGEADVGLRCEAGEEHLKLGSGNGIVIPSEVQCSHARSVHFSQQGGVSFVFGRLAVRDEEEKVHMEPESEGAGRPEDFGPDEEWHGVLITKEQVSCMPEVVRIQNGGKGDCFWAAISYYIGCAPRELRRGLSGFQLDDAEFMSKLEEQLSEGEWAEDEAIVATCAFHGLDICICDVRQQAMIRYTLKGNNKQALLWFEGGHFEAAEMKEACSLRAVAGALGRRVSEVQQVVHGQLGPEVEQELLSGKGVSLETFKNMLYLFDISALLHTGSEVLEVNRGGSLKCSFELKDNHIRLLHREALAKLRETNVTTESFVVDHGKLVGLCEKSTTVAYAPDLNRASTLAKCLLQGMTGVTCSSLFNNEGSLLPAECDLSARKLHLILGTFGCGKSKLFKELLLQVAGKSLMYISPRKALSEEFKALIAQIGKERGGAMIKQFKAYTFETGLKKMERATDGCVVVLDEIQLFPPGYLDLSLLRLGLRCRMFLVGDPCQSDYDSEKDRSVLGAISSDIAHVLDGEEYKYNILSYRFQSKDLQGRLPCAMARATEEGEVLKLVEGLDGLSKISEYTKICLVSSFEEKKIVSGFFGADCRCLTFGESTGLTFMKGCILVTHLSAHTSEHRWITALSRFRSGLALVNSSNAAWPIVLKTYAKRFLGRFVNKNARREDLLELLPGKPIFLEGFQEPKFGADEGKREEKLAGDPWLKAMINLFQSEDVEEVEITKELFQDQWFKTHLPTCEMESLRARWVHKILAKEVREKRMDYLVSEQFTEEHSKQPGKILTNAAERFEAIYPRHRASDTVTFIMAVRKRLRFSDPIRENSKLQDAMLYGPFLLKEFLKRVPLKPMHNQAFMEKALHDFEEKKTSKSAATIENHSNRSCRDWLVDVGMVFSKSQLCTKFDNRFRDAKAAQTIVCFQHSVLCRFAPYMRYIEMKLNEVLPEKYYVHSGKGLLELNEWVLRQSFRGVCTESDYEAFDASQDQFIVAFEIAIMRYLGLPNDLIEDYKYIKTHLGSKLGNFAIMRFSGEASTFLFNTMANMLFTFLRYDLNGTESICFAGDDMCANKNLRVSKVHDGFLGKLKLKAKVERTDRPTFCGWSLSPEGIFKKPQLVYERICIAKEMNNLANCIDNYAIEVSFAYKLGERIKEYMNEEEIEAMYNCVRAIVKHKHLLKSDIAEVFSTGLIE